MIGSQIVIPYIPARHVINGIAVMPQWFAVIVGILLIVLLLLMIFMLIRLIFFDW